MWNERYRVLLLVLFAVLTAAIPPSEARAQEPVDLAITHVNVVDVRAGRVIPDQTVLVAGGEIERLESGAVAPPAAKILDGAGAWLIPGLWDMHAHLRADGMPEWLATDWLMPLFVANGVTGVRDMASDCDGPQGGPVCLEKMREWQERIEAGELLGPRIVALSSFPLNPPWDYEVTEEQARQVVDALAERGIEHLKIYDRLTPDALGRIMDEARAKGLDAWGHVPLRMTAAEASDAGFRSIEHARDFLFDCWPGAAEFRRTTRSTSPSTATMEAMVEEHDAALCAETFRTLVENGTAYVPTHVTRRMEAFAGDSAFRHDPRLATVPPRIVEAWNADADAVVARDSSPEGRAAYRSFYRKGLEITGDAHRAGVQVLVGTDSGDSFVFPGSSVHDELGELVKAGLTPAEALRAATWEGAEFLGLADRYGSVEAGKRADLVLLSANPLEDVAATRAIRAVVFRGQLLDRERLDALQARAEVAAARPIEPAAGAGSPSGD